MAFTIKTGELNYKDADGNYIPLAGYNDGRPEDIATRIYNGLVSRAVAAGTNFPTRDEIKDMLGREYDSTATYNPGDYVINIVASGTDTYTFHLYRCIQTATGQDPSNNSSYWVEVNLSDEVSGLKSDLTSLTNNMYASNTAYYLYSYESGRYSVGNGKNTADNSYIRTTSFIHAARGSTINVNDSNTYRFQVCCYYEDNADTFFQAKSASTDGVFEVERDCYIRIAIGNKSGSTAATSIASNLVLNIIDPDDSLSKIRDEERYQLKIEDLNFTFTQITATGNIDTSSTTFVGTPEFIYCLKGSTINIDDSSNYKFNVAYYSSDDSSTFLGFKSVSTNRAFAMPSDGYVRFSIRKEPSTTLTDCSIINHFILNILQPIKNEVEKIKTEITHQFDSSNIQWVNKQVSGSAGGLNASVYYVATENFIYANAGSTISVDDTSTYSFNVALYHEPNLNTGSYFGFRSVSNESYTVPYDCYIRTSIKYTTATEIEDTSISSHLIFNIQQPVEKFAQELADKIYNSSATSPYYKKIDFGVCCLQDYYLPLGNDYTLFPDANTDSTNKINDYTSADFYTKFDTLVADYPRYITASEAITSSSPNHTLKWYNFNPIPTFSQKYDMKPVKIIIVSGQHGYEKATPLGLYYFVRDLLENWQDHPALNYIRNHVQLLICPLANPYGFDNNQRRNYNNVDLNRNYPNPSYGFVNTTIATSLSDLTNTSTNYYWMGGELAASVTPDGVAWANGHLIQYNSGWRTQGASPSSGSSAASEPETQAIVDIIDNNTDALLVIDWHNFGNNPIASNQLSNFNWHSYSNEIYSDEYFNKMLQASKYHFVELTNQMKNRFPSLYDTAELNPNNTLRLGTISDAEPVACLLKNYAMSKGILGMTFETMNGHVNYAYGPASRDAQKINAELIGNWLKNVLTTLAK